MNESLRQQFERLAYRLSELDNILAEGSIAADMKRYRALSKEQAEASDLVSKYRKYLQREADLAEARELLDDPDMAGMAREEIAAAESDITRLHQELQLALLPVDPDDERPAFLEIRAGTGGDESALFAADLARMYLRYAERQGWKTEILSSSDSDLGGYKDATVSVTGQDVYKRLRYESGVHRVQRVPATEAQGRIHTSTVTVAVMPEAQEVDVVIKPEDLEINVCRAGGHGGQGVNTTDSAVRIFHKPTGTEVRCQDERSQIKNKAKAMMVLRSRLLDAKVAEEHAKYAAERKSQVGTGERSEKSRTYNFPQNRVSDHRIDLTLYNLSAVIDGDLDPVIDPLMAGATQRKLDELKL